MKARPILFSGTMVRALLEGRKTHTRRLVKPQPELTTDKGFVQADRKGKRWAFGLGISGGGTERNFLHRCPYGQPGDLLWVRETWNNTIGTPEDVTYRATVEWEHPDMTPEEIADLRWTPSIHLPRRFSRLTLRITDVRVQRLQEISSDDARAEGVEWDAKGWHDYLHAERRKSSAGQSFETLWQSINGADSWAANPWVWAIGFEVLHTNIDQVLAAKQAA